MNPKAHLSEQKLYQKVEYRTLSKYQHNPEPMQEMEYETDRYTPYQNLLYKRALFGLSVYKKAEIQAMYKLKRKRIQKVHNKAQNVLNTWKQELTIELTNPIFDFLIDSVNDAEINQYGKKFMEDLRDCRDTDPELENKLSFRDLGISKEQIIDKLIEHRVLPYNFRELKEAPIVEQNAQL